MESFILSPDQIRYILQNAAKIKKDGRCIYCNGTGWENWDETGNDIKPGRCSDNSRCEGECINCRGVGFVW